MNNIKIYLFVYESVNEDGGDCEQKAFTSKETAIKLFKDEVASFKEEMKNGNYRYDTWEEDDTSAEFYDEGYYNTEHVLFAVREVELQDDIHELNSMENFVRSEIENQCEVYNIDTDANSKMVDDLIAEAMQDDHLWDSFYANLDEICKENEQYKRLYDEYWEKSCEDSK